MDRFRVLRTCPLRSRTSGTHSVPMLLLDDIIAGSPCWIGGPTPSTSDWPRRWAAFTLELLALELERRSQPEYRQSPQQPCQLALEFTPPTPKPKPFKLRVESLSMKGLGIETLPQPLLGISRQLEPAVKCSSYETPSVPAKVPTHLKLVETMTPTRVKGPEIIAQRRRRLAARI